MKLRDYYEVIMKNELEILVEEKGIRIPENKIESLAKELADEYKLLEKINEVVEEYLEDFGENHELYDL